MHIILENLKKMFRVSSKPKKMLTISWRCVLAGIHFLFGATSFARFDSSWNGSSFLQLRITPNIKLWNWSLGRWLKFFNEYSTCWQSSSTSINDFSGWSRESWFSWSQLEVTWIFLFSNSRKLNTLASFRNFNRNIGNFKKSLKTLAKVLETSKYPYLHQHTQRSFQSRRNVDITADWALV